MQASGMRSSACVSRRISRRLTRARHSTSTSSPKRSLKSCSRSFVSFSYCSHAIAITGRRMAYSFSFVGSRSILVLLVVIAREVVGSADLVVLDRRSARRRALRRRCLVEAEAQDALDALVRDALVGEHATARLFDSCPLVLLFELPQALARIIREGNWVAA